MKHFYLFPLALLLLAGVQHGSGHRRSQRGLLSAADYDKYTITFYADEE